ncbi:hypothetical protein [Sphingomonas japonica]|nr:hypothetical protein [Sphingomonas japonica]
MDFMKWLNSLGDLLYEVMSWLVFYPVTLARTILHPIATMNYADRELRDAEDEQFSDTLNPPLFLILSLLLTQAIDSVLGGNTNPIIASSRGLAALIDDDTTLLMLRLILFSMFPLMMATRLLRARRERLTREHLKAPFYAQCYACAPFALFLGIGVSLGHAELPAARTGGAMLAGICIVAYLGVQARWFGHHLQQGLGRGLLNAVAGFVQATVLSIAIGLMFVNG